MNKLRANYSQMTGERLAVAFSDTQLGLRNASIKGWGLQGGGVNRAGLGMK